MTELEQLMQAAKSGDPVAQRSLGWKYHKGIGVEQDDAEAARWFSKAADQGEAAAMNNLA